MPQFLRLPIILKDNINTVGFPTTAGTPFLKSYRPKTNAPLADTLFKQGAILFAKSNMHELALGGTSANSAFGFVKNPYNLSRITGGSSGGWPPRQNLLRLRTRGEASPPSCEYLNTQHPHEVWMRP
jgi:Asp-tRNA(Asn)/Glu-tRNA(Gln) amidotransferase A subunit family amidase